MKKSLILSIVMTLVLVISMSTATFAWYTANSNVSASVSTITAASATGNLLISTDDLTYSTSVVINGGTLNPAAPKAEAADLSAANNWLKGSKTSGVLNLEAPTILTGYVITGNLYLKNDAQLETPSIKISVDGTASDTLEEIRYLVYKGSDLIAGTEYNATSGTSNADYAASAVEVEPNATIGAIQPGDAGKVTLTYYIWIDGWDAENDAQGHTVNLTISFSEAA